MPDAKQQLRAEISHKVQKIPSTQRESEGMRVLGLIQREIHDIYQDNYPLIGAFAPLPDEIPWWRGSISDMKGRLSFPNLCATGMEFALCDIDQLIKKKAFGREFLVPPPKAPVVRPGLLLIPGLAFSPSGERLGRGKGFYDRYLSNFHGQRWGVCLSDQIVPRIPTNEYDKKVETIFTGRGIIDTLAI